MSRIRQPRYISIHFVILATLLAAVPAVLFAQGASVGIPENARATSYRVPDGCVIEAIERLTVLAWPSRCPRMHTQRIHPMGAVGCAIEGIVWLMGHVSP